MFLDINLLGLASIFHAVPCKMSENMLVRSVGVLCLTLQSSKKKLV